MARAKTVALTMINGATFYVNEAEFTSLGVSESAETIIAGYMRGTRGATMRVNTLADFTGDTHYINPSMIVSFTITYL